MTTRRLLVYPHSKSRTEILNQRHQTLPFSQVRDWPARLSVHNLKPRKKVLTDILREYHSPVNFEKCKSRSYLMPML